MTADFVPKHGSRKPVKKNNRKIIFCPFFGRSAFALPPLWLRCSSVPKEWRHTAPVALTDIKPHVSPPVIVSKGKYALPSSPYLPPILPSPSPLPPQKTAPTFCPPPKIHYLCPKPINPDPCPPTT